MINSHNCECASCTMMRVREVTESKAAMAAMLNYIEENKDRLKAEIDAALSRSKSNKAVNA